MGKKRVIAETGAGQHGVGTATAAAVFGLSCDVYMGRGYSPAESECVPDAIDGGAGDTGEVGHQNAQGCAQRSDARLDGERGEHALHYRFGRRAASVPDARARFSGRDRRETREQCLEAFGRLPAAIVACVGGGSNAAGMFYPFVEERG